VDGGLGSERRSNNEVAARRSDSEATVRRSDSEATVRRSDSEAAALGGELDGDSWDSDRCGRLGCWWRQCCPGVAVGAMMAASSAQLLGYVRSRWRLYRTGAIAVPPWAANPGAARGGLAADRRAPHVSAFPFLKILKNGFLHKKNRYKERKNPKKILRIGKQIWNTFHHWHFFQFCPDFEIVIRFWVKAGLTEMCSYKLIATPIVNPGELHFGGVHHDDLHGLH
jgi:hypothetical protein